MEEDDVVPEAFVCPITHEPMVDPVVALDGHSYSRCAIQDWFRQGRLSSPCTNERLASDQLVPNHSLRKAMDQRRDEQEKARWISQRNSSAATQSSQATDAELKKKDSDYAALREQMKPTSALARVRARRGTATGAAAPGKPEDAACMPQVATAASAPASSATGAAAPHNEDPADAWRGLLMGLREMFDAQSERDELKRERDELETKVMKLDMEIRNIQSFEERKYQVAITRLKKEVEELKRELKREEKVKLQMDAAAADIAAPALTSALARVRARRGTATGAAAPGKPEDAACMPQVATAASAPASSATGAAAPAQSERDELKRERDELETKVMKLDMEVRNIQSIEERKYQVEIMRLKYEVEELKVWRYARRRRT